MGAGWESQIKRETEDLHLTQFDESFHTVPQLNVESHHFLNGGCFCSRVLCSGPIKVSACDAAVCHSCATEHLRKGEVGH